MALPYPPGHFEQLDSVNVDSSYAALALAERNFGLNGYNLDQHGESAEFIQANAFDYLRHCIHESMTFDFVVLDPPKFAQHKRQAGRAARGYKELNLSAFKLVKAGGYMLTFSCSGAISRALFQKIVFGALGGFRPGGADCAAARRGGRSPGRAHFSRGRIPYRFALARVLRRGATISVVDTSSKHQGG